MKKKIVFSAIIASLAVGLCAGSVLLSRKLDKGQIQTGADLDPIVVGETQFAASSLTTTYAQEVTQTFDDSLVTMHYFLAKKTEDNKLVLAPSGKVFNYSSAAEYKGRVTNISSVTVNYTGGSLFIEEGTAGGGTHYEKRQAITSGTPVNLVSKPNHVMISNTSAETTITSISFQYTCNAVTYDIGRFAQRYRGTATNGSTVDLLINGTSVTFGNLAGTLSADNAGGFTLTLDSGNVVVTGTVTTDYKTLSFTGISGAHAAYVPAIMTMNAVYVLDDFESYSATGIGFGPKTNQASVFSLSGLRAAYYSDYGGGGSTSWIQNSNFSVCTSSDFLNLTTAVKHGGSKAATIKGSTAGWMRFWSREIFDQNQHYNFGSGNTLSFWAHSAYTNTACTSASSDDKVHMRVQVYYQNFVVTDSNRNSTDYGTGTKDFYIVKNSDWTEYTFDLDPTKQVYAINFMIDNSGLSGGVYVPIDDITIQTVSSPKQVSASATRITKTYNGSVTISVPGVGSMPFTVKVALGANGHVYGYAGANMQPTNYVISGSDIIIYTVGTVTLTHPLTEEELGTYSFGDWTGTLSNGNNTLTINKADITGTITEVIGSSQIVLNQDDVLIDGSSDAATMQSMLKRQHNSSGWQDSSGDDTITQNSDYYIEGTKAIRLKPWADGSIRMIVKPAVASTMSLEIESIAFWYYVPSGCRYTLSVFSYDSYEPSTDKNHYSQAYTVTYRGTETGWHYVNLGLKEGFRKNVSIFVDSCAKATMLDYITYF